MEDAQKAEAITALTGAVSEAAKLLGIPVAGSTAEAIGQLVVDGMTNGTLNRLVAHARATAEVINTEVAAELAARSRT